MTHAHDGENHHSSRFILPYIKHALVCDFQLVKQTIVSWITFQTLVTEREKMSRYNTYVRKTVSPCLTVIFSITLLSDWESPWLRTGRPAGRRNRSLNVRTTRHFQDTVKYPQTPIFVVKSQCRHTTRPFFQSKRKEWTVRWSACAVYS